MKTTKNKIVKGIKILSNIPLYYTAFVSAGCDWFVGKPKEIRAIQYKESEQNSIYSTEKDDNTSDKSISEGGIDNPAYRNSLTDNNPLLGPSNTEEVSTELQQQPTISQDGLKQNPNNNTSPTLVPENNAGSKHTTSKQTDKKVGGEGRGVRSNDPKKNADKGKVDNNQLESNRGSKEAKPNPSSGQPLKDTSKQRISPDQSLPSPLQKLKAKINKLERLGSNLSKKQKSSNKKLLKKTEDFCTKNKDVTNLSENAQKLDIETALKVADSYITQLKAIK